MYLKLENIQKKYDEKVAVDKLSLDIPQGEIFGIIGPNGAGKTTTIRMIMNIPFPMKVTLSLKGSRLGMILKIRSAICRRSGGFTKN